MELNGNNYTIGKIVAPTQLLLLKRVGPIVLKMPAILGALAAFKENKDVGAFMGAVMSATGPLMAAIGEMKDEDFNFVLFTCLKHVKRQVGDKAAPVVTESGHLMYQDIEAAHMLMLTVTTLQENLGRFFPDLLASLPAPPAS
jgi:hypothetical protein